MTQSQDKRQPCVAAWGMLWDVLLPKALTHSTAAIPVDLKGCRGYFHLYFALEERAALCMFK